MTTPDGSSGTGTVSGDDFDDLARGARPLRARSSRRVGPWIAVAVLAVVGLLVWVFAGADPAVEREVYSPLLGQPVPEIVADPVVGGSVDGGPFRLSSLRGEWVVVNFFATWCTPCIREHPELIEFQQRHALAGDASVVSVVYSDQVGTTREFFDERGGDWPVVDDPDGRVSLDFGVSGVPESYVVAPDGTVVAKLVGGVTAAGLDRIIAEVEGAGAADGAGEGAASRVTSE